MSKVMKIEDKHIINYNAVTDRVPIVLKDEKRNFVYDELIDFIKKMEG